MPYVVECDLNDWTAHPMTPPPQQAFIECISVYKLYGWGLHLGF